MTLNKADKRRALKEAKEEALKRMCEKVDKGLAAQMELVMLLVLHDKFGFGAERCKKAITEFEELWDSVNKNYLTLEDIQQTVRETVKLDLEF